MFEWKKCTDIKFEKTDIHIYISHQAKSEQLFKPEINMTDLKCVTL